MGLSLSADKESIRRSLEDLVSLTREQLPRSWLNTHGQIVADLRVENAIEDIVVAVDDILNDAYQSGIEDTPWNGELAPSNSTASSEYDHDPEGS